MYPLGSGGGVRIGGGVQISDYSVCMSCRCRTEFLIKLAIILWKWHAPANLPKYRGTLHPGVTQPIVGVYFTALYRALASSRTRLLDHTQRRITVGRNPLNE